MFFGNQVKLGDLGLAKFIGDSTHRSRLGAGTLGYQPPEAQQRAWKSQSDAYSFWATYIKLRTGHEPFGDENPADVYERQRQGAPVLDGLEDFERGPILHGLAPRPEDRPQHGVVAQLRLLQPGREHVLAPASRPFVAPQAVVIEAIVVPEVRVEPPVVRVASASVEGLPEVPKETLELLGRRRGLDQAIAELKAGRHPALRPASAAVEMAARQEQEMRADLAAHAPKLPAKLCQEIVKRVAAEPGGSIAALMRLDPKADANELQQFILRVRNLELASRAHQQARGEFQRSLDAEIAKLSAQRQETANKIGVWQSKDLRSIVERLHAVSGGDRHFPLVTWMRWQQPLLARYERNDIVELMDSAENYYKYLDLMKSPNSFGMEFVWIDAGEFDMGSPDGVGSDNERPLHRVRITRPFMLSKYPVTV
ncbi:MAG TPA: SUMF1/EgtB/PvdO family nonheme iron enzyme, partial [Pirellulaceae bacterium]|nr:SUMF1/EgtB/PvdO family nonheme iron enzyme [Pirellulaceae bacterium]